MRKPDFQNISNEPRIDMRMVQQFLDWFENDDWEDIGEGDREQIERARSLKELVTGEQVPDETFETGICVLIRENAFTDYVKDEETELNEYEWKNMPKCWQENIDWDGVAEDLRDDYAEIDWEGDTYLFMVND